MGKQIHKKKGYNIYQLRMYSIQDELLSKENFMDHELAKSKMLQYFEDGHYGPAYSRGIVRQLDPIRKSWVVPTRVNNPHALLLNPEETAVEEWKLTLYALDDTLIEHVHSKTEISKEQVEIVMLNKNAFYGVVSACELGIKNSTICRIQINSMFHLSIVGPNGTPANPHIPKPGENLALIYAKALAEDKAETERLIEARRLQQDR